MDFTLYLPDEIGQRAKEEELKLSRLLRDAVIKQLERRDAMAATLEDAEVYEIDFETADGKPFIGRITGKLIAGTEEIGLFLTSDKRWLITGISDEPAEEVDEEGARNFLEGVKEADVDEWISASNRLGIKPVIDL